MAEAEATRAFDEGAAAPAESSYDEPAGRGRLTIADKVVQKVATLAAREVDDVVSNSAALPHLLGGRQTPKADAVVAGGHARIGLDITIAWPRSAPEVSGRVRDHVLRRVSELIGITVDAVDVTVTEVVRTAPPSRRVR